jgi:hypothetical protein
VEWFPDGVDYLLTLSVLLAENNLFHREQEGGYTVPLAQADTTARFVAHLPVAYCETLADALSQRVPFGFGETAGCAALAASKNNYCVHQNRLVRVWR